MKKIKSLIVIVFVTSTIFVGCGAPQINENQSLLTTKYYSRDVEQNVDILVDDVKIGALLETGIFNNTWQFSLEDGTFREYMFSDYVDLGVDNSETASNYQIKDKDGVITGYVQETLIPFDDGKHYEYLFYDKDMQMQDYYFDHDTRAFYDWDGNLLVECTHESTFEVSFFKGTVWKLYMVFDKDTCPVPYEYMLFAYIREEYELSKIN